MTSWVQGWVATPSSNNGMRIDSNGTNAYLRMAAMEQAGGQDSYVAVTFANTPANWPSQSQLTPADGASTMSLTPTLTSAAMTDPEGDPVKYWFRIATNTDAETGQQLNSGWLTTPTFQVPTGVLQDGMTYYWKVFTWDGWDTGIAGPGVPWPAHDAAESGYASLFGWCPPSTTQAGGRSLRGPSCVERRSTRTVQPAMFRGAARAQRRVPVLLVRHPAGNADQDVKSPA